MDRIISYPTEQVRAEDGLYRDKNTMIALGMLAQLVCGLGQIVDGFVVTPSSTALSVSVGPGSLLYQDVVDATAYGVLPADSTPLAKLAQTTQPTVLAISGPGMWTVYVTPTTTDDQNLVLPFVNAAAPTIPFSGPGGAGGLLPTRRALRAVVGISATGAPTGSTALYTITVPSGATSIASGNVAVAAGAPFVTKLPFLAPLFSPGFSGVPTAPTAAANTDTAQLATTAFVLGQAGTAEPVMDGVVSVGTSFLYSRQDHRHPTDTTRADVSWVNANFSTYTWVVDNYAALSWVSANFPTYGWTEANCVGNPWGNTVYVGWSGGGGYLQAQVNSTFLGRVWTDYNANLNCGNPGYMVFPNGFIIQWGTSVSWTGENSVTFPITFPNACLGLTITEGAMSWDTYAGGSNPTIHAVGSQNQGGFNHMGCRWSGGVWFAASLTGNWIATGF